LLHHTHIHRNAALILRKSWRSLDNFKYGNVLTEIGSIEKKCNFGFQQSRKGDGTSSYRQKYLNYSHEVRADEPVTEEHKNLCGLVQIFSRQLLRESSKTRRKERTNGKESEEEKKK